MVYCMSGHGIQCTAARFRHWKQAPIVYSHVSCNAQGQRCERYRIGGGEGDAHLHYKLQQISSCVPTVLDLTDQTVRGLCPTCITSSHHHIITSARHPIIPCTPSARHPMHPVSTLSRQHVIVSDWRPPAAKRAPAIECQRCAFSNLLVWVMNGPVCICVLRLACDCDGTFAFV